MNRKTLSILLLIAGVAAMPACNSQYTNYPVVPTAKGLSENPNSPGAESAMIASVQYVASRYGPSTRNPEPTTAAEAGKMTIDFPMTVAAPAGMRKSFYERLARQIGPEVSPLTPESLASGNPIYYITRVWLRGVDGQVDVMRPMPELGRGTDGKPVYQTVTVRLQGSLEPWHVVHARAWEPGIDPVPEPYFVPDVERINQYQYTVNPPPPPQERMYWESGTSQPPSEAAPATPPADSPPPPVDLAPSDGPIVQPPPK